MSTVKTESVTFRILPEVKAALRAHAAQEHRSLSNMLEVMIRDYRGHHAVPAVVRRPSQRRAAETALEVGATGFASDQSGT